jgi:hypothetical protein
MESIKDISAQKLVYIDESGMEMNIRKDMAWCQRGKLLPGKKSGKYFERTNIIAGLNSKKSIAPMYLAALAIPFESWVEQFLIKELEPG